VMLPATPTIEKDDIKNTPRRCSLAACIQTRILRCSR
jgi:hypothetical protein